MNCLFTARTTVLMLLFACLFALQVQAADKKFKAVVLVERGGGHEQFDKAALQWLESKSEALNFDYDVINNADPINEEFLKKYQLFIQLDFPPYTWKDEGKRAFEKYIEEGWGGWIGFHHATLLGEFDGYAMWDWFSKFMGDIQFKNYIPGLASGDVIVEAADHPVMKGIPSNFTIEDEEWYTYNQNPRSNVKVLARVNEDSYSPMSDVKMGDHPVIWSNEKMKARNVYIFMGHHPGLLTNQYYARIFENAIVWASEK